MGDREWFGVNTHTQANTPIRVKITSCRDVSCYKMAIMSFDRFASPPLASLSLPCRYTFSRGEAGKSTRSESPFHNIQLEYLIRSDTITEPATTPI